MGLNDSPWYRQQIAGRAGIGTRVSWTSVPSMDHHPDSPSGGEDANLQRTIMMEDLLAQPGDGGACRDTA